MYILTILLILMSSNFDVI